MRYGDAHSFSLSQVSHERFTVKLHIILNLFCLDVVEEVVVHRRSLVLKRRRAIAHLTPANDAVVVDYRPLHRCNDFFSIGLLLLDGALRELTEKLGGGFWFEMGGDSVVHGETLVQIEDYRRISYRLWTKPLGNF
jgi:hypothetical protein